MKQEKEVENPLVYSSSRSMIEENQITVPFENSYFLQHKNVAQDDRIKGLCEIELHLVVPVIEESIKVNILQISNESATLETLNLDSHEALLLNPGFKLNIISCRKAMKKKRLF